MKGKLAGVWGTLFLSLAVILFVVGLRQWLGIQAEEYFREPTTHEVMVGSITLLCVPLGAIGFELLFGIFTRETKY